MQVRTALQSCIAVSALATQHSLHRPLLTRSVNWGRMSLRASLCTTHWYSAPEASTSTAVLPLRNSSLYTLPAVGQRGRALQRYVAGTQQWLPGTSLILSNSDTAQVAPHPPTTRRGHSLAKCTVRCSHHQGGTTLYQVLSSFFCQSVRGRCTSEVARCRLPPPPPVGAGEPREQACMLH